MLLEDFSVLMIVMPSGTRTTVLPLTGPSPFFASSFIEAGHALPFAGGPAATRARAGTVGAAPV